MKHYRPLSIFPDGADLPIFTGTPDLFTEEAPIVAPLSPTHDQLSLLEANMTTVTCPRCNREVSTLYHVANHPGEYCIQCRPDVPPQPDSYVESVNGTVIGDMTTRYEFWTLDNKTRIAYTHAGSDDGARHWFANHYPTEYRAGVRMRIFD